MIESESLEVKELRTTGSIVVGIDGSKAAIRAALWSVEEAMSRDVPLHLLYIVEQGEAQKADQDAAASKLATAETAVRRAAATVERAGQVVKIEKEIAQGSPIDSLIRASASAAMVCVGSVGLRHFKPGRVGSTAAALVLSARCPVAIIHGHDNRLPHSVDGIVVEVDGSPDNGVLLAAAMEEARLRNATVKVIRCRRTVSDDIAGERECDRRALADLDRRLARWRRRYPLLRVESVAVHGTLVEYLANNCRSVQLVIVGAPNRAGVQELIEPVSSSVLQDTGCSLLVVDSQRL